MAYDTNNLKANRGGATLETSDKDATPAGLYRHPETGQEIITLYDPLFGDAQSEGIVRLGFVRVRDAKPGEVKTLAELNVENRSELNSTLKGVVARLDVLERENEQLRKEKADLEGRAVPSGAEQQSAETAKENAAQVVSEREDADVKLDQETGEFTGEGSASSEAPTAPLATESNGPVSGSPATGDQGDGEVNTLEGGEGEETEKPLSQQNKTELLETAQLEGVEGVSSDNTNKEIKEAIEAKRAEESEGEDGDGGNE